jgi:hypothetical protein
MQLCSLHESGKSRRSWMGQRTRPLRDRTAARALTRSSSRGSGGDRHWRLAHSLGPRRGLPIRPPLEARSPQSVPMRPASIIESRCSKTSAAVTTLAYRPERQPLTLEAALDFSVDGTGTPGTRPRGTFRRWRVIEPSRTGRVRVCVRVRGPKTPLFHNSAAGSWESRVPR